MAFKFKRFHKDSDIQNSEPEIAFSKKAILFWLIALILLMSYPYFFVLRLQNFGGFLEGLILYMIPMLLCPVLFYKSISSFNRTTKLRIWVPIIAFFLFPVYLMFIGKSIIERELISNGVKTNGKVTHETYMSQDKQKNEISRIRFFCEYTTEKAAFNTRIQTFGSDSVNYLNNSQTVVIYSKSYPNVFMCGTRAINLIEQNKIDTNVTEE